MHRSDSLCKGKMKRYFLIRLFFCAAILSSLGACGGYARSSGASGVQVYGTVDAGVSHESR
jgi:hypothetical protein